MIDLLIFGATHFYHKLREQGGSHGWTPVEAREKVLELAQICSDESERIGTSISQAADALTKHDLQIQAIQRDLRGLVPASVTSELEAIYKWMEDHIEQENQLLHKLARQQLYWRIALTSGVISTLGLATFCLLR